MVDLHHQPESANLTKLRGQCIEPFLDVTQFSKNGGRKIDLSAFDIYFANQPVLQTWMEDYAQKFKLYQGSQLAAFHVQLPIGSTQRVCGSFLWEPSDY
jgi:hypothetical protein